MQLQRLPEAIRELTDAVSLDPQSVDASAARAGLGASQRHDRRSQHLSRSRTAGSELVRAHNLGLVLLQSGNAQKAETAFQEATRLKPQYAEAHYNLALAFRQEGKKADAQQEFEKAFQLAPELKSLPLP
jgi:Tfp pilus assembly protein PilF